MSDNEAPTPDEETDASEQAQGKGALRVKCPYCGTEKRYTGDKDVFMCRNRDECGITVDVWRGRLAFFADQPNLRLLAHAPRTRDEFEEETGVGFGWTKAMQSMADKLEPATSRNNPSEMEVDTYPKTVYYLPGDERRAINKFIEVNPNLVRSSMNARNNRLRQKWPDYLYQMLVEQWELLGMDEDTDYGEFEEEREHQPPAEAQAD